MTTFGSSPSMAASTNWLWVHYVQFAALLIVVAGLLLLYESVRPHHLVSALEHGAIIAATGTVAVFALNMAVDAVALKRAVDAWAAAPESEKMVRFASAEAIRWLELGANSFFQILLGLSLTLFGLSIARTAICWRVLGWIGVLAGLGLILGGLLTGRDGFAGSPVQTAAQLLFMTMALGMVVSALFRVTPRDPTPSLSPTATHQAAAR